VEMNLEEIREKNRAALISMLAALGMTALKLGAGLYSNSLGVLAEAAHSALDLLATGVTLWAIRLSSRPADQGHAYGHGKAENLAALAETLILLFICGWILQEGANRLFSPHVTLRLEPWVILSLLLCILVDLNRARLLRRLAKKYRSQALEADALHFSTDILSSTVVLLGLGAVWTAGFLDPGSLPGRILLRADALAAIAVAVITAHLSLRLGKKAINLLLDAGSADHLKLVEKAVASVPEVLRLNNLRLRESGPSVFIDMQLTLPASASLEDAHNVTRLVERAVLEALPGADLTIHYEPEESDLLTKLRNSALEHDLEVHAITLYTSQDKGLVTLHAAVPEETRLAEASRLADRFEESLRSLGHEFLIHLEPKKEQTPEGALLTLSKGMEQRLLETLERIRASESQVSRFHRLRLLKISGQLNLSLHCCMPGELKVKECHQTVSRIEGLVQKEMPEFQSVTIHADVLEETDQEAWLSKPLEI